jgi:hypothetical protein
LVTQKQFVGPNHYGGFVNTQFLGHQEESFKKAETSIQATQLWNQWDKLVGTEDQDHGNYVPIGFPTDLVGTFNPNMWLGDDYPYGERASNKPADNWAETWRTTYPITENQK